MFYDIVFDLIKIIRSLKASQNDCQILIFVKAIYVVGEKMTRNSGKIVKSQSCPIHFRSEFSCSEKLRSTFFFLTALSCPNGPNRIHVPKCDLQTNCIQNWGHKRASTSKVPNTPFTPCPPFNAGAGEADESARNARDGSLHMKGQTSHHDTGLPYARIYKEGKLYW